MKTKKIALLFVIAAVILIITASHSDSDDIDSISKGTILILNGGGEDKVKFLSSETLGELLIFKDKTISAPWREAPSITSIGTLAADSAAILNLVIDGGTAKLRDVIFRGSITIKSGDVLIEGADTKFNPEARVINIIGGKLTLSADAAFINAQGGEVVLKKTNSLSGFEARKAAITFDAENVMPEGSVSIEQSVLNINSTQTFGNIKLAGTSAVNAVWGKGINVLESSQFENFCAVIEKIETHQAVSKGESFKLFNMSGGFGGFQVKIRSDGFIADVDSTDGIAVVITATEDHGKTEMKTPEVIPPQMTLRADSASEHMLEDPALSVDTAFSVETAPSADVTSKAEEAKEPSTLGCNAAYVPGAIILMLLLLRRIARLFLNNQTL